MFQSSMEFESGTVTLAADPENISGSAGVPTVAEVREIVEGPHSNAAAAASEVVSLMTSLGLGDIVRTEVPAVPQGSSAPQPVAGFNSEITGDGDPQPILGVDSLELAIEVAVLTDWAARLIQASEVA